MPAVSQAQRGYLYSRFGKAWVDRHHFNNPGPLPERVSNKPLAMKPKLGSGARFAALKSKLASKGASNPGALAAYIGRKKFGAHRFAQLSAKGRK